MTPVTEISLLVLALRGAALAHRWWQHLADQRHWVEFQRLDHRDF